MASDVVCIRVVEHRRGPGASTRSWSGSPAAPRRDCHHKVTGCMPKVTIQGLSVQRGCPCLLQLLIDAPLSIDDFISVLSGDRQAIKNIKSNLRGR